MPLTAEEIDALAEALAPKLVTNVQASHHEFWIDPETHYQDHQRGRILASEDVYELKQLVGIFRVTKSLWLKAFIGAAIVGSVAFLALSLGYHK